MLPWAYDDLRYYQDFCEIIDVFGSSSLEEALEFEVADDMMWHVLPGLEEVKGRWCLP